MSILTVAVLGLLLTAMQYVMYFRLEDDVIFSHKGANGPESKTSPSDGATGGEVCHLQLI